VPDEPQAGDSVTVWAIGMTSLTYPQPKSSHNLVMDSRETPGLVGLITEVETSIGTRVLPFNATASPQRE